MAHALTRLTSLQPNSVVAKVGDIVSFEFYPLNHSVIGSAYGYPCIPIEDTGSGGKPFFSGFFPTATVDDPVSIRIANVHGTRLTSVQRPTWNLTVNHTQPTFYYCGAEGSCTDW